MGRKAITRAVGAVAAAMTMGMASTMAVAPAAHAAPSVGRSMDAIGMPMPPASWARDQAPVRLTGSVRQATEVSIAQLVAASRSTITVPGTSLQGRGASLDALVEPLLALPTTVKNPGLRVTVTVVGAHQRVTFALPEVENGFGNHDATILTSLAGERLPRPVLVVGADHGLLRTVVDVRAIRVTFRQPAAPTQVPAGSLLIRTGRRSIVVTPAQLRALPQHRADIAYQSGNGPQSHSEAGPRLSAVLQAAGVRLTRDTWVLGVGSDGYAAAVTPAESWVGGRELIVSLAEDNQNLAQPRLIAAGDEKGGRDVSDLVELEVGRG